jgi:hypothetical protein
MKSKLVVLAATLAFAAICRAQTLGPAAAQSPEAAVKASHAAMQTMEGIRGMSQFFHPDELARFKEMLLPVFRKDAAGKGEGIRTLFGPEATLASIEAMTPSKFMDAFVSRIAEHLRPKVSGEIEVVGSVAENDLLHLVTRIRVPAGAAQVNRMKVITVKRHENGWKLMLSGELEGMLPAIAAQP